MFTAIHGILYAHQRVAAGRTTVLNFMIFLKAIQTNFMFFNFYLYYFLNFFSGKF